MSVKGKKLAGGIKDDFDLLTYSWFAIYTLLVILSFLFMDIVKYAVFVFQFVWLVIQGRNFICVTPERVKAYNSLFADTHHIVPPSEKRAVPDTYHMVLLLLMVLVFVVDFIYVAMA